MKDSRWHNGTCDVCGKKDTEVVVCASSMGPISFSYCHECFDNGLEPYDAMVAYIGSAGHYPADINQTYVNIIENNLKCQNKSRDQFIKDVEDFIKSIENQDLT